MEYEMSVQQGNLTVPPDTMYLDHRQFQAEMDRRVRLQCFQQRKSEDDESFVGRQLCSIQLIIEVCARL